MVKLVLNNIQKANEKNKTVINPRIERIVIYCIAQL